MMLLSGVVVGLVLTAWYARGLYLHQLSELFEHIGTVWFGYTW